VAVSLTSLLVIEKERRKITAYVPGATGDDEKMMKRRNRLGASG
jgi:hypothetical protein